MNKVLVEQQHLDPLAPDWVLRWLFPELHSIDRKDEEIEWIHILPYYAETPATNGFDALDDLSKRNLVGACFNLQDGKQLMSRGVLAEWFPSQHLPLWRSAAIGTCGNHFVPIVQNIKGQYPAIRWWWLQYAMYPSHRTFLLNNRGITI